MFAYNLLQGVKFIMSSSFVVEIFGVVATFCSFLFMFVDRITISTVNHLLHEFSLHRWMIYYLFLDHNCLDLIALEPCLYLEELAFH